MIYRSQKKTLVFRFTKTIPQSLAATRATFVVIPYGGAHGISLFLERRSIEGISGGGFIGWVFVVVMGL